MKRINVIYIIVFAFLVLSCNSGLAAVKSKKSRNAEEVLKQGREAFYNYNFDEASALYDEYRSLKNKSRQPVDEEFEIWESELEVASNAFDRVRKIVIVDSISMPLKDFYKAYQLSQSSGEIDLTSGLLGNSGLGADEVGFKSERGDFVIYPKETDGEIRLFERQTLLDNSIEENESLEGKFEKSGDYLYPFMSADGQTLYFANNGNESMGGLDIFVAQKDALTGEYRQPLNLGMPFNSPYDDFMLAIDEENGLGWWATNRNSEEDKVTIYVFLYDEIRKNYPDSTDYLADFAKITSYKDTWVDDNNQLITPAKPVIANRGKNTMHEKKDFEFPLGNGIIYTRLTDFRNRKASDMMRQFMQKQKELDEKEKTLLELRKQYKRNTSGERKILDAESEIESLRQQQKAIKSEILRLEKSIK